MIYIIPEPSREQSLQIFLRLQFVTPSPPDSYHDIERSMWIYYYVQFFLLCHDQIVRDIEPYHMVHHWPLAIGDITKYVIVYVKGRRIDKMLRLHILS